MYTRKEIENIIKEWVLEKIGSDFQFREFQLESIVNIIENILDHKYHNYIVEAPTGSGKSLINIISAGVLADSFNISSYILCSDLFLWEQYDEFLKKHKKINIGILKGQLGNYNCKRNNEDIKHSECQLSGLSWNSLFRGSVRKKYGFECALSCEYVKARKKAIKSKCTIMTYHLFLHYMNNPVYQSDGQPIFAPHDVVFCDEAHNIPDIIQLIYSPCVQKSDLSKLEIIYNQFINDKNTLFSSFELEEVDKVIAGVIHNLYTEYPNYQSFHKELENIWKIWNIPETRKDEDSQQLNQYIYILELFDPICNYIKDELINKKNNNKHLSKEDIQLFKEISWFESHYGQWIDFKKAIDISGPEYLLKDVLVNKKDNSIVTFKCTKEDIMVWYFFLRKAKFKVMLSATIGGKDSFDERMGFKHEKKDVLYDYPNAIYNQSYMVQIPSTFDYQQSPIYFLNKFKMSFNQRDISFKHLKTIIYSICKTKFKDQKGMIQTGSYEFSKKLYDEAPLEIQERMLIYNGSKEKTSTIQIHQWSDNTILVGPTLNTGVNLPGDDCRFIIILKVPYPSLMNKLVNERNKLYPLWYNSHTSNEIIQGIGRGVRYNGDWCVTYILDACFNQLYISTKDQYPPELQSRIEYI